MNRKLKIVLGVFVVCLWVLPVAALAHHLGQGMGSAPEVVDNYAHGANAQNSQIGENEGPDNATIGNGMATATQDNNSGADAGDNGMTTGTQDNNSGADAGGGDGGSGGGDGDSDDAEGGSGSGNGGSGNGNGNGRN